MHQCQAFVYIEVLGSRTKNILLVEHNVKECAARNQRRYTGFDQVTLKREKQV